MQAKDGRILGDSCSKRKNLAGRPGFPNYLKSSSLGQGIVVSFQGQDKGEREEWSLDIHREGTSRPQGEPQRGIDTSPGDRGRKHAGRGYPINTVYEPYTKTTSNSQNSRSLTPLQTKKTMPRKGNNCTERTDGPRSPDSEPCISSQRRLKRLPRQKTNRC
ncbi:hypothetical protein VUR80DRAFT_8157 [Thermomyces stellatus]